MRLLPWMVAQPATSVSGVMSVAMSENPTTHVGSARPICSQSSRPIRSIAVSPPHGGTTARIDGSSSMPCSSAARWAAGALMWPEPSMQSPTTTW